MKRRDVVIIFLVVFGVFYSALSAGFVWDDGLIIVENEFLKNKDLVKLVGENVMAGSGRYDSYYRPIMMLSLLMDKLVWGDEALGYHVTNLVIHGLVGMVLWLWLEQVGIEKKWRYLLVIGFLVHPVVVVPAVYISGRGWSLYALGVILSLIGFGRWLGERKLEWLGVAWLGYLLALGANEAGVVVAGLWGLVWVFGKISKFRPSIMQIGRRNSKKIEKTKWKWEVIVLAGACLIAVLYAVGKFTMGGDKLMLLRNEADEEYNANLRVRMISFGRSWWKYMETAVGTGRMQFERRLVTDGEISNEFVAMIVMWVAIAGLATYEFREDKKGYVGLGFGWMMMTLLPVSGIVPLNGRMFEHWLYLPLIGMLVMGYGLTGMVDRRLKSQWKSWGWFVGVAILVVWAGNSMVYAGKWRNERGLYEYLMDFGQDNKVLINLGVYFVKQGEFEKARELFAFVVDSSDKFPEADYNLGSALMNLGQYETGAESMIRGVKKNRRMLESYEQTVAGYELGGNWSAAETMVEKLVILDPASKRYWNELGKIYEKQNKLKLAKQAYERAKVTVRETERIVE